MEPIPHDFEPDRVLSRLSRTEKKWYGRVGRVEVFPSSCQNSDTFATRCVELLFVNSWIIALGFFAWLKRILPSFLQTGMYSTLIVLGSFIFLHSSCGAMNIGQVGNGSLNNTPNRTSPKIFSCEWKDLEFPITYGPAIACVLAILIGGFQVFVGYKYQRSTLFIAGFSGVGLLTYIICLIKSNLALHYVLLITTAMGTFAGILCTTVKFVGLFTLGLSAGFCIAMGLLLGFVSVYQYHTIAIPFGVICGLAVVMAGTTVWWKRVFLIISSSVFGGAMIMGGIDYFIEDFWLLIYGYKRAYIMTVYGKPCIVSWIILSIWPVMSIVGLLVQFLKTGRKPVSQKKGESRSNHSRVSQSLQNNIV